MATRTIKTLNGDDLTLSSDELSPLAFALAEIYHELAAEQGNPQSFSVSLDELARRLVKKGYDPATGDLLN